MKKIIHLFLTNLSKIDAAAGVIPGRSLASLILSGLFPLNISFTSFDSPGHLL